MQPSSPFTAPRIEAILVAGAGLLAIAIGWAIATYGLGAELGETALVVLLVAASAAVVAAGPAPCLAAIAALTASGVDPSIVQLAGFNASGADVFWIGAAGWWVQRTIQRTVDPPAQRRPRIAFGQVAAIAFFGWAGLTVLWSGLSDPNVVISWLRIIHTVLLAVLAASLLESKTDVRLVLGGFVVGGIVAVGVAGFTGDNLLATRSGGLLPKNQFGLIAGLMLVLAIFTRWPPTVRWPLAAVSLFGLVLAKSVSSFVATGFAIAVGVAMLGSSQIRVTGQRLMRIAMTVGVAAIVVFSAVQFFRPEQLPSAEDFRVSSTARRVIVGATGLEIFERNPVVGIGWRESGYPDVIADRDYVVDVRRRFQSVGPELFPDVIPTTVHNTYIQVLAELGLIGIAFALALIATIGIRTVALLRRLGPAHGLYPEALAIGLGLLLTLVWYNENPLFGAQPETVIPAIFVGILAAIARITAPASALARDRYGETAAVGVPARLPPAGRGGPRRAAGEWEWALRANAPRIAMLATVVVVAGAAGLIASRWAADEEGAGGESAGQLDQATADYGTALGSSLERLGEARRKQLADLSTARTPGAQAGASAALADAHEQAATALARANVPESLRSERSVAVGALERVADGYRRLAAAARGGDAQAYAAARADLQRAEAALQRQIAANLEAVQARFESAGVPGASGPAVD